MRSTPPRSLPHLLGRLAGAAVLLAALALPSVAQLSKKAPPDPALAERLKLMAGVKSWGYQLRRLSLPEIARSALDLVVIDHALSAMKRFQHQFEADRIADLKMKPDGGRRIVLAYMSIGEAETYRFYWQPEWEEPARRPPWLGAENPQWPGNFNVRYWDPEWQRLMFGSPEAYIDRILAAGFDGVYLDRADAFMEWGKANPAAEGEMVRFILRLTAYARERNPAFLVVMQNAEELLDYAALLSAIDGLAKEDLFYGIDHDARPNDADTVAWTVEALRKLQRTGRRVLVVEYLDDIAKVVDARRRAEAERYVIHFAPRDLGELWAVPPDQRAPTRP